MSTATPLRFSFSRIDTIGACSSYSHVPADRFRIHLESDATCNQSMWEQIGLIEAYVLRCCEVGMKKSPHASDVLTNIAPIHELSKKKKRGLHRVSYA